MRAASYDLMDRIATNTQVGASAPSIAVYVKQRYWDDRDIWNGGDLIDDHQKWYQLSNRALSIEIQEDTEQFASSFTVTFSNEEGQLSPDNYTNKWPDDIFFNPNEQYIVYARQLYQNNEMRIYLGYGDELVPFIHGWTGDVKMTADGANIVVQCMTSYKHIIHQTIKDDVLKAPSPANLYDVLKFFFNKAGVTLHGEKMYVPGTDEEWIITGAKGTKGQAYDEVVRELIDTTFHYIRPNVDGSCTLMPIPKYLRDMPADIIFDEGVNLTSLEYTITDQDIYNAVTVKAGNHKSGYNNTFLYEDVLLRRWREEIIEVPWADSYLKRREVAIASHVRNLHKWRTLNAGVVGDPRLQLWDKVGIRESTSSQTWNWHIKGIQTMIDADSGFFQILQLSVNYGYETTPPSDLSPIQVSVPTIRLKVWDFSVEDGDILNIYCNDKVVKKDYYIKNDAVYIDIDLVLGNNMVVFEGVSAGRLRTLSGRLQVLDTSNKILFDVGSLPDLEFARANVDRNGRYRKKPSKTWLVARVN